MNESISHDSGALKDHEEYGRGKKNAQNESNLLSPPDGASCCKADLAKRAIFFVLVQYLTDPEPLRSRPIISPRWFHAHARCSTLLDPIGGGG